MSSFVLVHGAWSDALAWDLVTPRLRALGHQVAVPDLPAHGADATRTLDTSLLPMLSAPDDLVAAVVALSA